MELQNQSGEQGSNSQTQFGEQSSSNKQNNQASRQSNMKPDYVQLKYRSTKDVAAEKLATGLGLFSIALGLAEVLAPSQLGEFIGVGSRHRTLLPAFGIREIASGIGILSQPRPATAVWSRVGGDALDLACLGAALLSGRTNKARVMMATGAVLGVAALDFICARQLSENIADESKKNPMAPTTIGQPSGRQAGLLQ